MPRPQVDIMQSSAEATHEAAPKAGSSVTGSRDLSIASTPAETFPQKEVSKKAVSPTNLSEVSTGGGGTPRVGNATCWNTLQSIQDTIVETSNAARASRLSSKVSGEEEGVLKRKMNETIGVARVGAATCWSSFSKMAWDLALPDVDASKHSADVRSKTNGAFTTTNVERLKNLAAQSVKAPELPPEDVDEDGFRVEVIENVDSL